MGDAADLRLGVDAEVRRGVPVFAQEFLPEIDAPGQFPVDDKIGAADPVFPQGGFLDQGREYLYRADVAEQPQLFAEFQQPLFGAHPGTGVIVVFGVADGPEEDGVGGLAQSQGLIRERTSGLVNGNSPHGGLHEFKLMAEGLFYGLQAGNRLGGNFRADSVAREQCDFQFH